VSLSLGDAAHTLVSLHQQGERFDLIVFDLTEADDPPVPICTSRIYSNSARPVSPVG
jgi:hypothetical protein